MGKNFSCLSAEQKNSSSLLHSKNFGNLAVCCKLLRRRMETGYSSRAGDYGTPTMSGNIANISGSALSQNNNNSITNGTGGGREVGNLDKEGGSYLLHFLKNYPRVGLRTKESGRFVCHRRKLDAFLEANFQHNNPLSSHRTAKKLFIPEHCTNPATIRGWHSALCDNLNLISNSNNQNFNKSATSSISNLYGSKGGGGGTGGSLPRTLSTPDFRRFVVSPQGNGEDGVLAAMELFAFQTSNGNYWSASPDKSALTVMCVSF